MELGSGGMEEILKVRLLAQQQRTELGTKGKARRKEKAEMNE